ncbi:BZ3500_MvSof-1268-A1-R1_Chr12-3g04029 [Microbotryum saponariae]|uniref:BZ3500_MvSof-1268-A1-R1_Chr12-3g04029 protein n=1 Tax=Microbotryum saponariae TaxID=289078 RepID=A0A2X0NC23_9BASI|nr:BZ3500_MvSof-1268-A1-R1_Chr12-3g04029 [Microbotryum saponariae]SDA02567.1 BZ3501_MvSof-1269-A2-R1_Chr12-3g03684 [Microbotryum saponariae]
MTGQTPTNSVTPQSPSADDFQALKEKVIELERQLAESGVIVDAHKSGEAAGSSWATVADPIEFGEHLLTCEILPSSSTGGYDFRIIGVANN